MQPGRNPTILDVAALAGVHPGTVSRALSHPQKVAAQTRERIESAVRELGFVRNRAAAGLKLGRTGNIAVIVPDITNPHFASLVRAVERAAREAQLQVLLVDTGEQQQLEIAAARTLLHEVDGFVVLSPRRLHRDLAAMAAKPAVFVNRPVEQHASVLLRTAPAIQEALQYLATLGHRTLAYLPGPRGSWSANERRTAVRRTARSCGMDVVELEVAEPTFEAALEMIPGVLRSRATVVMAFNDQMALGALAGMTQRGVAVPGEISVVGCDNVPMSHMVAPPLTTIATPTEEAGATALALLGTAGASKDLFGTFLQRGSTGPAR